MNYGKSLTAESRVIGNIPVYGSSGITGWHNKALVPTRSIIVGRKGTVGSIYKEHRPCFPIDTVYYIAEDDNKYDFNFLFYLLQTLGLNEKNSDSAVPGLNRDNAYSLYIGKPSLPEQKAIAAVLSSLDDKIELLREQNKTLEAIAQALFKEWFVDFNFPDDNGKPYKKSGGKMIDSELGEIPEGWEIRNLGEEFDISIGRTPPRIESQWFSSVPTGKKWISIKDIGNCGIYIFNTSEYLTDEAVAKFNIPVIPLNTTIVSFKMTVGKLAITTEAMLSNEAIAHLIPKTKSYITSEYIYCYLQGLDFNSLGSTSSIVTAINSTMIKQIQIIVAHQDTLEKFNQTVLPIFKKNLRNQNQIQSLSQLRDKLLPKLMKGEIRVKDVNSSDE